MSCQVDLSDIKDSASSFGLLKYAPKEHGWVRRAGVYSRVEIKSVDWSAAGNSLIRAKYDPEPSAEK